MMCLFIFSIYSWFSLRRLYLYKNLSISSRLSILLAQLLIVVSYDPLYFCGVSHNFSFLISNFIGLSSPLPFFFLMSLTKGLSIIFFNLFKEPALVSLIFAIVFFVSIYFCSGLSDFFPSTNFRFCLFLFL